MSLTPELADLDRFIAVDPEGAAPETLRKFMQLVREQRLRVSEKVAVYGSVLLNKHSSAMKPDELWSVYEQVALGAMDIGAQDLARSCVSAIKKQFPSSIRANKIRGMYYEASGQHDKAKAEYQAILQGDGLNQCAMRRMIALEKSSGSLTNAMAQLHAYLTAYSNDVEAWEECADLCIQAQQLRQAAFCYEELITLGPTNPVYFTRYADVLYTIGTAPNWKLAKTYYAKALALSGGSSRRALYGITACAAQLSGVKGRDDTDPALVQAAADTLRALYAEGSPDKLFLVDKTLKAQGVL